MNYINNNTVVTGSYVSILSSHNNSSNTTFYFKYNFNLALLLNNYSTLVFSILCTNHYKSLFNPYFFYNYLTFYPLKLQIFMSYILFFRKNTITPRPFLFPLNQRKKPLFGFRKKLYMKKNNIALQNQMKKGFKSIKILKSVENKKSTRTIQVYTYTKKIKKNKSLSVVLPWRQYFKFLSQRRERLFTSYVFKAKRFKKFSGLSYRKTFKKFSSRRRRNQFKKGRKQLLFNRVYKFKRFRSRMKLYTTLQQYLNLSKDDNLLSKNNTTVTNTQYTINTNFSLFHKLFFQNQYKVLTPLLRVSSKKFDVITQPINGTKYYNWRHYNYTKKARKRIVFLTLLSKLKRNIKIISYLMSPKVSDNKLIKVRRTKLLSNKRRKYSLPRQYLFLNGTKPSFIKFRPMKTILLKRLTRFYKRHLIKIKNTSLKRSKRWKNYKYTWKKRTLARRSRKSLFRLTPRLTKNIRTLSIKKLTKLIGDNWQLRKRFLRLYMQRKVKIFLKEWDEPVHFKKLNFRSNLKGKQIYLTHTKRRYLTKIRRRIYRSLRKTSLKIFFSTLYYTRNFKNKSKNLVVTENNLKFGKKVFSFPVQEPQTTYHFPRRLNHYRRYKKLKLLRRIVSMKYIRIRTKALFLSAKSIPKFLTVYQFRKQRRLQRQLKWKARKKTSIFGSTLQEVIAKQEAQAYQKRYDERKKQYKAANKNIYSQIRNSLNRSLMIKLNFMIIKFRKGLKSLPLRLKQRLQKRLLQKSLNTVTSTSTKVSTKLESNFNTNVRPKFLSSHVTAENLFKPKIKPVQNFKFTPKFPNKNKLIQPSKESIKLVEIPKLVKIKAKPIKWHQFFFYFFQLGTNKIIFNKLALKRLRLLQPTFFNFINLFSIFSNQVNSGITKNIDSHFLTFLKNFYKSTKYIWKNPQWKTILKSTIQTNKASSQVMVKTQTDFKPLIKVLKFSNSIISSFFFTLRNSNPKIISNTLGKFFPRSDNNQKGLFLISRYKSSFILSNYGFLFIQTMRRPKIQLLTSRINKYRYSFFYKNDIKRFYLRNTGRLKLINSMFNRSNNSFYSSPSLNWNSLAFSTNSLTNVLTTPKENAIATGAMSTSTIGFDLVNYRQQISTNPLIRKTHLYNRESSIKRIKFKPGYSRIWRRSREAINFSLRLNLRYQYRLTQCLHRLHQTTVGETSRLYELTLMKLLLNARFVLDLSSSSLMLQNNVVYVNGNLCSNPNLYLFKGDFIQLAVSLKYYIVYRWLYNYNFQHKFRLHKLSKSKWNKSRTDLHKQKSSHLPDWIFLVGYRHFDIPSYMEVDYFTLSVFILYDQLLLPDYNPLTFLESRNEILNMYNWKYIV